MPLRDTPFVKNKISDKNSHHHDRTRNTLLISGFFWDCWVRGYELSGNWALNNSLSSFFLFFFSLFLFAVLYYSVVVILNFHKFHLHIYYKVFSEIKLLDNLQKLIYKTVGPSLAAFLEPLAHHQNVVSLSLFYRYYFGKCSSELAQLVPLPYSWGRSSLF